MVNGWMVDGWNRTDRMGLNRMEGQKNQMVDGIEPDTMGWMGWMVGGIRWIEQNETQWKKSQTRRWVKVKRTEWMERADGRSG